MTDAAPRAPVPANRGSSVLAPLRVVAITDRRLMVHADVLAAGDIAAIAEAFGTAVERALRGCPPGSVAVQVREKDADGALLLALVRAARRHAYVFVNDRVDVALAAGARAVHLPERGLAVAEARALFPGIIGISRHAAGGDPGGADLVQIGPIWETPGKGPPLGLAALGAPCTATLVAVGGIDSPDRARAAASAGADAVALIRAAWSGASLSPLAAAVDAGRSLR